MSITPAVAALIGAGVGASASILTTLLAQLATGRRDRERRMWDRRVETYDDMMATIRRFARMRAHAVYTSRLPESPERRDEAKESAFLLTARIDIYSSSELRTACEKAFEATQNWMKAWEAWEDQPQGRRVANTRDDKWQLFLQCTDDSKKADRKLLELVRTDVHGKRRRGITNYFGRKALP
ncbi:hypothetical protein [Streptomyces fulvoviolaceus]|uniref:hypothetical protein n=1 Tax=Streptomyces fulvoviolaceus TaxID=285535 RepID=UPI0021BFBC3D|nr:hypothetical protein [Streptomyces fulvoviolaceus]MCT9080675.1 hypothetical protein [Streptomyces fulvoviolaceus]